MKVCAVIVTYGDRFHLLNQVIDTCFKEGINKIIIVDNASKRNSRKQLKEYERKYGNKLKVIYLDENIGSAGGYKIGFKEVYNDRECDFIWLLDDDNKPKEGALKKLIECWRKINLPDKEHKIALLSWRSNKGYEQIKAIIENKPSLVLGRTNSFLGFHVKELPIKVLRTAKRFIKRLYNQKVWNIDEMLKILQEKNIELGKLYVAPYGGMFFHKKLLDTIGFPDERFFVYADDHEWSYRIVKNGGKILLCWKSQLEDLEISWHIKDKNLTQFHTLLNSEETLRIYYSVRNRVYFEIKDLVTSKLIYNLNIFTFKLILFILALFNRKMKRYRVIDKAIEDGLNSNLGRRSLL